ncbi:hypothetical protein [Mesorhizobium sp. B1-1-5]|uniref:hypothetical protein n=1 Tax=Mesorhizobium sp. B1-1-5 TaxID=2589979 RepID=UPI001FEF692E|nr:hypothetical protein [Mesorhizobium sp. B1-1-5]
MPGSQHFLRQLDENFRPQFLGRRIAIGTPGLEFRIGKALHKFGGADEKIDHGGVTFDTGGQIADCCRCDQGSFPELLCAARSLVVAEDDHAAPIPLSGRQREAAPL